MKKFILGLMLLSLGICGQALALDRFVKVRVLSRYALETVEIESPMARLRVVQGTGDGAVAQWPADQPLTLKAEGGQVQVRVGNSLSRADQVWIEPPRGSFVNIKAGGDLQKKFLGRVSIRIRDGALFFVEELPLEGYVRGVLEAEVPAGYPPEALKAMAVLIRTFALAHQDRHAKEGFELCDLTHCQVYGGRQMNYLSFDEAVKATRGVTLGYQLKLAETPYHSTCGGHTSSFHCVFGGKPIPYLQGVSDGEACADSPHSTWESTIPLKVLEEVLKKEKDTNPKGEIKNLRIADQEEGGGRASTIAVEGPRTFEISAQKFLSLVGRYLGWSLLKSNWFEVEVKDGQAHFKGRGLGHGVGLCQWGARGLALKGKNFEEILQHYYPGTQLIER